MFNVDGDKITITDDYNQKFQFLTDGNGDYYFTLYSNHENKSGDGYSFLIDEQNPIFNYFKRFIEQENDYIKDKEALRLHQTPYFIINDNSVKIADQNHSILEAKFIKFYLLENQIRIIFNAKFPTSIRVNGVGRVDHYPFFIPVIDLFNSLQQIHLKNIRTLEQHDYKPQLKRHIKKY